MLIMKMEMMMVLKMNTAQHKTDRKLAYYIVPLEQSTIDPTISLGSTFTSLKTKTTTMTGSSSNHDMTSTLNSTLCDAITFSEHEESINIH